MVNVLNPTFNQVRRSKHLHNRCLRSTVPALAVPCIPMPMVTSVSQMAASQVCSHPAAVCLDDHVLPGDCPDVMTFGSQRERWRSTPGWRDKQRVFNLLGDKRAHS